MISTLQETLISLDITQPADMSAGAYGKLAFRVVVLMQLAYEAQLLEVEDMEIQIDRARNVEKVNVFCQF